MKFEWRGGFDESSGGLLYCVVYVNNEVLEDKSKRTTGYHPMVIGTIEETSSSEYGYLGIAYAARFDAGGYRGFVDDDLDVLKKTIEGKFRQLRKIINSCLEDDNRPDILDDTYGAI